MQSYKDFIENIQSKGLFVFSKQEALKKTKTHENSLRVTLARNLKAGNLSHLGKRLYLITPLTYKKVGAPPPEWYIDALMKAHGCQYYVGLLTAASLYGAAHQAPQVFQVLCDKKLPEMLIGGVRIRFYYSRHISKEMIRLKNTPVGYMNVSTPEATAFDLIKYMRQSGHINHVATVLSELGETLKAKELKKMASLYPPAYSQRLGYMLDELGYIRKTSLLNEFIQKQSARYVPLRSDWPKKACPKQDKWHVVVNETLDPDI